MTVEEFNAMMAQMGEFFKQYLANPVFRQNLDLLMRVSIQQKDKQNALQILDMVEEKYQYELRNLAETWKPNILNAEESLDVILNSSQPQKSFCRFGDGELEITMGHSIPFQEYDPSLAEKLLKILTDESDGNCCVCLPRSYFYSSNVRTKKHDTIKNWKAFAEPKYRAYITELCSREKVYLDTEILTSYINKSYYTNYSSKLSSLLVKRCSMRLSMTFFQRRRKKK